MNNILTTKHSNEAANPRFCKGAVSSRALLDIPQYSSQNVKFFIGDTVRSYRSAFDNNKPFKNHFIEGVVIATTDKVLGEGYLVVKWQIENYFGEVYKFKMPHNGTDTFSISLSSPFLVKKNICQLAMAL